MTPGVLVARGGRLGGLLVINDSLVKHLSKTADLARDDDEREGLIEGEVASL